jgi:hypothetical protein
MALTDFEKQLLNIVGDLTKRLEYLEKRLLFRRVRNSDSCREEGGVWIPRCYGGLYEGTREQCTCEKWVTVLDEKPEKETSETP